MYSALFAFPLTYYVLSMWLQGYAYKVPLHWWVFVAGFLLVAVITVLVVIATVWRTINSNPIEVIKKSNME